MSTEERIALDALEQVGIVNVTMWQLRCLAAFRDVVAALGWPRVTEYATPRAHAEQRYKHDLFTGDMDHAHSLAQWDDAEWVSRRSGRRPTSPRPLEPEPFQESLT